MRLENKVAVITGTGSGMGKAMAIAFAKEGAKVVLGEVVEEKGRATEQIIKDAGGQAIFVNCDVSKAADIDRLVSTAVQQFGKLDIMVNNAGILDDFTPCIDASEELYDRIMNVNLKGVFLGCKRALQEMIKQGSGKIINTASIAGLNGMAGGDRLYGLQTWCGGPHQASGLRGGPTWYKRQCHMPGGHRDRHDPKFIG